MDKPDTVGKYRITAFAKERTLVLESLIAASWRHHVKALLELDVTRARAAIHTARREHGKGISFLSWILSCMGKACSAHPQVHAWRKGRRKVVIFDDVDVGTYVEREINGELVPTPIVVRKTNEKSAEEIFTEIQNARTQDLATDAHFLGNNMEADRIVRISRIFPRFVRMLFWRRIMRNGLLAKRIMGTVGITSLAMFGKGTAWPIPPGIRTLNIGLGPVVRKPGLADGKIVPREHLCLTVLVDHDIVDGAPSARFIAYLVKLIQNAYGLEEYMK